MRPKGKLFVLLVLLTAIGLVTASGAFTTVTAERTADVSTAGDSGALLGLEPHTSSNGAEYANNNTDNQLELELISDDGGSGVNLNATTEIAYVFNITNQGSQEVEVEIEKVGDNSDLVDFYNATDSTEFHTQIDNDTSDTTDTVTLGTGETVQVSMKIDTTGSAASGFNGDEQLLSEIIINATAT